MTGRGLVLALLLALASPGESSAWSLRSHRWVVERAIETLPEPLRGVYRAHGRELGDDTVAPDLVRRKDRAREERRHYIRLENYGSDVDMLARASRVEAERRFGKKKVETSGLLPWVIMDHARGIERAMRRGDWKTALRTSGFGAHYVSDALMPLHTSANFDGQKSAAGPGLHEALERGVVDRDLRKLAKRIDGRIAPPSATPLTQARVLERLRDVNRDVAPLIAAHEAAAAAGAVGSPPYLAELERKTGALLDRRLAEAVEAVGSFWLSAWAAAGRPAPPASALK